VAFPQQIQNFICGNKL